VWGRRLPYGFSCCLEHVRPQWLTLEWEWRVQVRVCTLSCSLFLVRSLVFPLSRAHSVSHSLSCTCSLFRCLFRSCALSLARALCITRVCALFRSCTLSFCLALFLVRPCLSANADIRDTFYVEPVALHVAISLQLHIDGL